MSIRLIFFIAIIELIPVVGLAQKDTLIQKQDSLHEKNDSLGGEKTGINPSLNNETIKINFRTYFSLLGSDIKKQFTSPFHTRGKDWLKVGAFGIIAATATLTDE